MIGRLPAEGEKVRALGKSAYAAVVDSVGGDTLAYALSVLNYGGVAAISGLARSADLPTTVMPFILRGRHPCRHRFGDVADRQAP